MKYLDSMNIRFRFAWYDMWIGAYWDRVNRVLYVCPVPMIVIRVSVYGW